MPGSFMLHYLSARVARILGQFDKAKEMYVRAYRLSDKNAKVYSEMCGYFAAQGRGDVVRAVNEKLGKPE